MPGTDVLMVSAEGMAIRFSSDEARPMGRRTRGVQGMRLRPGDRVVSVLACNEDACVLTATERGYGKRTPISEYRRQKRAGLGLIDIKAGSRNGHVVGAIQVTDGDRVMLVTDTGRAIQIPADGISVVGRNTMGVRLMRIEEDESVVSIARLVEAEDEDDESQAIGDDETEELTAADLDPETDEPGE